MNSRYKKYTLLIFFYFFPFVLESSVFLIEFKEYYYIVLIETAILSVLTFIFILFKNKLILGTNKLLDGLIHSFIIISISYLIYSIYLFLYIGHTQFDFFDLICTYSSGTGYKGKKFVTTYLVFYILVSIFIFSDNYILSHRKKPDIIRAVLILYSFFLILSLPIFLFTTFSIEIIIWDCKNIQELKSNGVYEDFKQRYNYLRFNQ